MESTPKMQKYVNMELIPKMQKLKICSKLNFNLILTATSLFGYYMCLHPVNLTHK